MSTDDYAANNDPANADPANNANIPAGPGPARSYRQIHRSHEDRIVSGLSGGLGRYVNIDPVIVRILFVVLTLFGGSGILLYLIGWVAIPDEGQSIAPIGRLSNRLTRRRR